VVEDDEAADDRQHREGVPVVSNELRDRVDPVVECLDLVIGDEEGDCHRRQCGWDQENGRIGDPR
jgi:hypothetical protein